MIRKLRVKFIVINMLLVSLVLLIVFSAIFMSTYHQLQEETQRSLKQALNVRLGGLPPAFEIGKGPGPDHDMPGRGMRDPSLMIPVFTVEIQPDGAYHVIMEDNVTVTEDLLDEAVAQVLGGDKKEGILYSLQLRYLLRETPNGTNIAFADRGNELARMRALLLTCLGVGAAALAAFFAVSLFLSRWALRPVEIAWRQQRQFVADASHELKTPLTIILANLGILLANGADTIQNQQKWLKNTQTETLRMKQLVDDLLFLAKSDQERPRAKTLVNFSDVVWNSILPFEAVAFEKGVQINSDVAPEIFIMGDEAALKQLTVILMDNACKYSEKGGVITALLYQEQDKIYLTVNNTGSLIPEHALEDVFDRFYRVDKSRERSQGGYGLGLAIAETIVMSHRGKITVESNEERGTTFTVKFTK